MKLSKIFAVLFLFFLMGSTAQAQTEVRTPGDFTKVNSSGSWDVIISQGDHDEVKLVSNGFDLDKVITEVDGRTLKIKLVKGNHRNVNFTAYVTVRELEAVGLAGSGDMQVDFDVYSDEFAIGSSGSGNLSMQKIHTGSLKIGMSGSGQVEIAGGSSDSASIGQSGSGNMSALELTAGDVKIGKSGSGSTYIGIDGELKLASSGSGNVYYKGNISSQSVASSGSGRIIKRQSH